MRARKHRVAQPQTSRERPYPPVNLPQPGSAADDAALISRFGAPFIVRAADARDPHFGDLDDAMIGSVVVFANGAVLRSWSMPSAACLRSVVMGALRGHESYEFYSARQRQHGDRLAASLGVRLDRKLQLNHTIRYVHAPGTFAITGGELWIFKDFCEENIDAGWKDFLLARRDEIERDFRTNDANRRFAAGLWLRRAQFRLLVSEPEQRRRPNALAPRRLKD